MISFTSMWAVVLRYARVWKRDPNLLLAGFYWPLLDIVIWGFLGSWIQQSRMSEFENYGVIALLAILLWQIVARGCNIMITAISEELWSNNIVNLFSLPLRTVEWMGGLVIFTALMMMATSACCMVMISLLYNVSILYI
ncbi:hypothetical protein H0X06_05105, partial [Candidatus Dependentiae bacterium]|nr:hypothetical protein [Candidatus Dependentiae bacterium]